MFERVVTSPSGVAASVLAAFLNFGLGISASQAAAPTEPAAIVPSDASVEELWNDGVFTEGAAVGPEGAIYFSDIPADATPGRVLKFDPRTGKTTVHSADSGKSNGLMFDRDGRLIAACGACVGKQGLCEILKDGSVRMLAGTFEGKRFNAPNDVVVHPSGDIYFTDPRYLGEEPLELDHMSVYRYVPSTGEVARVTTEVSKPNGIVCSPDGNTLYIAETDNGSELPNAEPSRPKSMRLLACSRRADGTLGRPRVLVDFGDKMGIDGMTVDEQGRIYAALRDEARPGIAIYNPDGQEVADIPTVMPTNCCFGRGGEASTLYITAGTGLYRIKLNARGFHPAVAGAQD